MPPASRWEEMSEPASSPHAQAEAEKIYEYLHTKCVHIKAHSDIPDYEPCITCAETFIERVLTTALQAQARRDAKLARTSCFYIAEKPDLEKHNGTGCDTHHEIIARAIESAAGLG